MKARFALIVASPGCSRWDSNGIGPAQVSRPPSVRRDRCTSDVAICANTETTAAHHVVAGQGPQSTFESLWGGRPEPLLPDPVQVL
jgi:hypothetical protein